MVQLFRYRKHKLAYDPNLIPPLHLMQREGVDTLEEWFSWGSEWSMILRLYGNITAKSSVLEIGCGLGRTAYPLRYALTPEGLYHGFDVCQYKIAFLKERFSSQYPNFSFQWADVHNTHYNPEGRISPLEYSFPYPDNYFDIVYAASVFTHMLPNNTQHYFQEAARVTKSHGRCVFSFFQLDNYQPGHPRPLGFAYPIFDFDHQHADFGPQFAMVFPDDPERMTAYQLRLIEEFGRNSGLTVVDEPVPGMWSGTKPAWKTTQDLVVLEKS